MQFELNSGIEAPSIDSINIFESSYRVKLPKSYLDILTVGNGAIPNKRCFIAGKHERMIDRFLCIHENPKEDDKYGWYDIGVVLAQIEDRLIDDEELIGTNVVPIILLFGGDYICLDYRNKFASLPKIILWNHELSDYSSPYFDNITDSFESFLKLL